MGACVMDDETPKRFCMVLTRSLALRESPVLSKLFLALQNAALSLPPLIFLPLLLFESLSLSLRLSLSLFLLSHSSLRLALTLCCR